MATKRKKHVVNTQKNMIKILMHTVNKEHKYTKKKTAEFEDNGPIEQS